MINLRLLFGSFVSADNVWLLAIADSKKAQPKLSFHSRQRQETKFLACLIAKEREREREKEHFTAQQRWISPITSIRQWRAASTLPEKHEIVQ